MKKIIFISSFLLLCSLSTVFGKGINASLGSGTEMFRLELGYSINENLHTGIRLCPGFKSVGFPSYTAGFIRKTFKDRDLGYGFFNASYRGYIGGSLGLINLKGNSTYDFMTGKTTTSDSKSTIGFSADLGVEILYGSRKGFGTFIELNGGQVPNSINKLNEDLNSLISGQKQETKIASSWGIVAGIRLYFN